MGGVCGTLDGPYPRGGSSDKLVFLLETRETESTSEKVSETDDNEFLVDTRTNNNKSPFPRKKCFCEGVTWVAESIPTQPNECLQCLLRSPCGGKGVAQQARSYVGLSLPWPAHPICSSPTPAPAPARPPITATSELFSCFAISCAYCSARGHGGIAERYGDCVVPSQVLLRHLQNVSEKAPRKKLNIYRK